MVGLVDPNASKLPEPVKPQENWLKGKLENPIQIKRPAQGRYSPKSDEKCLFWCSQSARGRADGQEPWCRSLCIRRVFEHEVKRLTNQFAFDNASHSRAQKLVPEVIEELKWPLPPEGQPSSAIVDGMVGGPNQDGRPSAEGVRYWEEGWYVWGTKSRWASQEKMDLMMMDLDRQTNWMRSKEDHERDWYEAELQRVRDNVQQANDPRISGNHGEEGHTPLAVVPEEQMDYQEAPQRHPYYPKAADVSFLIRVPTKLPPINQYVKQAFQPTQTVLSIVNTSIQSGDQKELALRAWELTREGAPFKLVRNVFKVCAEAVKKGPKDEDDS